MDRNTTHSRLFVFYVVPDFTMLALSSAVEILRLANVALGDRAYSWRLVSRNGGKVTASCGLALEVDSSIDEERRQLGRMQRPSMALVCGGQHSDDLPDSAGEAWLRECRHHGIAVAGVCDGANMLARAGLLRDRRCAIHWEAYPGFAERFGMTAATMGLYAAEGGIHTCAGGTATIDMMLRIVRDDHGDAVVSAICERALVDRIRQPTDCQRRPFAARIGTIHPTVARIAEKMEETISEPSEIRKLADCVGLSRRQVERLFRNEMGCTPARYFMKLRLERARLLLLQTAMPVVEVAIACGFVSASHFSRSFREMYAASPQEMRSQKTAARGSGIVSNGANRVEYERNMERAA